MIAYTRDTIILAGVMAGYAFFGFLGALQVTQIRADPVTSLLGGGILGGWTFFAVLAGRSLPGPPGLPPLVPPIGGPPP